MNARLQPGGRVNIANDKTVLSCHALKRQSDDRMILDVDWLHLDRGQTYLLSGPNGAGKTTLLRVLAGLERASCSGFVFDGARIDLANYPMHMRRRVGFVHHHPVLFSMSITGNIGFGLRAAGVSRADVLRRTDAAIQWAGLESLQGRRPQALSAGEKQRVALARAHALDPVLYLLDEPTANLDEGGKELVTRLVDAIAREGRTLLIACHDRELLGLAGVTHLHMIDGRLDMKP